MNLDENELRKALESRSGEVTPEYRARVRQAMSEGAPAPRNWMAMVAVLVVTALTATSVGALVASRHQRPSGPVASGPRVTSPTPRPVGPAANVQLSAPSARVVWALVDYGTLYRSTDSGDHWEQRSVPSNFGVRPSMSFISADEGWLLAPGSPTTQCDQSSADVWHTIDGASTWVHLHASGLGSAQCKELVYFADARHGFVTAWDDNHAPSVYSTGDGGLTWRKSTLPDGPLFTTSPGGQTLRVQWLRTFGAATYLEATASQPSQPGYPTTFIYRSVDGGATWTWKQKLASPATFMVTESQWLQLAPDVMQSTDGGNGFGRLVSDWKPGSTTDVHAVFPGVDVGYLTTGGTVERTTSGGVHWTSLATPWSAAATPTPGPTPAPTPIALPTSAQLSAPSADVVWVIVQGFRLFLSIDRGQTWNEKPVPVQDPYLNIAAISFIDSNIGWASVCPETGPMELWRTTDGARSWSPVKTTGPAPAGECALGLWFVDQTHGFATTYNAGQLGIIYRTSDGGASWSKAQLPNPPTTGYSMTTVQVARFGSAYYLATYRLQPGVLGLDVLRSTDGGATWSHSGSGPNNGGTVVLVTATRWLDIVVPDQSLETTDGGKTWHSYASDYSQAAPIAPQVVFGSPLVGYATVRGSIQRSTDGGLHWEPIETPGTQAAPVTPSPSAKPTLIPMPTDAQISAPSAKVAWALIAGGRLFRTTDGGVTWQERPWAPYTGGGGNPVISFVDAMQGWALFPGVPATQCSQAGAQLWRTSDAGSHWTLVANASDQGQSTTSLTFDQCKEYAAFVDAKDGFVAGHDTQNQPIISRTADGGTTWSQATLPDPPGFARGGGNTLQVASIQRFGTEILAGTEAQLGAQFVYRSTDGGASWTFVAAVNANAYVIVAFVTATRWVSIGNDGSGLETTDGGRTWHVYTCDYRDAAGVASTFVFADASVGYGTVRGGIQVTGDGGKHWVRLHTPGT